jgi:hypothetical protein
MKLAQVLFIRWKLLGRECWRRDLTALSSFSFFAVSLPLSLALANRDFLLRSLLFFVLALKQVLKQRSIIGSTPRPFLIVPWGGASTEPKWVRVRGVPGQAPTGNIKLAKAAGLWQRDQAQCTNVIGTLIAAWTGSCLLVVAICFPRYSSIDFYLSTDIDGWA